MRHIIGSDILFHVESESDMCERELTPIPEFLGPSPGNYLFHQHNAFTVSLKF